LSIQIGLKYEALAFLIFSICGLGGYIWLLALYLAMKNAVSKYGYGDIPLNEIESFAGYEEIAVNGLLLFYIAAMIVFLTAYHRAVSYSPLIGQIIH